jgi:predicted phosphodiesterase
MTIFLGDIHGNFKYVKWAIQNRKLTNCNIVQVGDFGIGTLPEYDEDILVRFNEFLTEHNVTMYVIRGNHDDPKFFKGNHIFSHLKLLPDYTQLEIDGYNFLFVGGAVSIDRNFSLEKMQISASYGQNRPLYWFDEVFVLDEEKIKNIKGVDIIVTHTAPEWCHPDNRNGLGDFVMEFVYNDRQLETDLLEERKLVSKMFNMLKENGNQIKKHYYGHFHRSEVTLNGMTEHILLGINEMRTLEDRNDDYYEKLFN